MSWTKEEAWEKSKVKGDDQAKGYFRLAQIYI